MIFEKVRTIIAQQLSIAEDRITPETSLTVDIGADSLDIFQIVTELEEVFDMEFPPDIAPNLKTVGDAVAYIEANAGQ
ncbi:MAG: acyl carrier protein [Defluviitaleaceae bacterium]|nr:acyl carrier protein [Defluviitaleaceae bacterium]